MPAFTSPLSTYAQGTNVLTPVQNPQDARLQSGSFIASISINAGQMLARTGTNGLLPYALSAGTGTNTCVGIAQYTFSTDASGNVYYGGGTVGSVINPPYKDSSFFTSGDFDTTQLYTYDATSRANLGGITVGYQTNWVHIP